MKAMARSRRAIACYASLTALLLVAVRCSAAEQRATAQTPAALAKRPVKLQFYVATDVRGGTAKVPAGYKLLEYKSPWTRAKNLFLARTRPDLIAEIKEAGLKERAEYHAGVRVGTSRFVIVELKRKDAQALEKLTGKNVGKHLVTVLNGDVLAAPVIKTEIADGEVVIASQGLSDKQLNDLLAAG